MPEADKKKDSLFGARIKRLLDGKIFSGDVVEIERGAISKDILYLIRYEDGDLEHLTKAQVETAAVRFRRSQLRHSSS